MAGHEFIHFYETNFFDCDARQRLSIPGMLRFFEDIALRQREAEASLLRMNSFPVSQFV